MTAVQCRITEKRNKIMQNPSYRQIFAPIKCAESEQSMYRVSTKSEQEPCRVQQQQRHTSAVIPIFQLQRGSRVPTLSLL